MVLHVYSPQWFWGIDYLFEIVSVIVGLLIGIYGYKTYKFTSERRYLHFSAAFFLVAAAFFTNILSNLIYYTKSIEEKVSEFTAMDVIVVKQISWISQFGSLIGIFFMLLAFLLLFITVFKITDKKVNILMIYFVLVAALYSKHSYIFFHGSLFVLITFLFIYYYEHYKEKRNMNRALVMVSFLLMTLSQLLFILSAFSGAIFAAAQTLQLIGYIVLLVTFMMVLK